MWRKIGFALIAVVVVLGAVSLAFAQEEGQAAKALRSWAIYIGAALAVGLPALATGYAQGKIGAAGAGALAEKPELLGPIIIMIAIPETAVILGFVVSILLFVL